MEPYLISDIPKQYKTELSRKKIKFLKTKFMYVNLLKISFRHHIKCFLINITNSFFIVIARMLNNKYILLLHWYYIYKQCFRKYYLYILL